MNRWSKGFVQYYDRLMGPLEQKRFRRIRAELVGKASGNVLEVGCGTGINFDFYKNVRVTAIEPNPIFRKIALERASSTLAEVHVIEGNAEQLPFTNHTFDTVIGTLILCTIPDPVQAIREMKRVCKPAGTLLLFEHVRHKNIMLATLQDVMTPIWKKVCDGCHLNRDTIELIREEGFEIVEVKTYLSSIFVTIEIRNRG
ncbi:class I SAM-dependent methyltransferase [Paenibacillus sp. N1-5-1-14]|uniref:class I SAM-dependent methyltransferase n=1 Tax=Paenibacillus radicibacter TaxID=2972488 RepID=UPI0021595BF2|nr:class I SAM-dependent methyltransferase [Paenibacillus radicibacter]MCR8644450.1 class I SAM-dependent methyltransferase [Paenibacillus radicibacter]